MDSLVSWQCAFWALVPLAINSMLQSAGKMAIFTSRTSLVLRVSPIVCTADAIMSLQMVAWYSSARAMNLRSAARMWHLSRMQRRPHENDTSQVDTAFEASQPVRLFVFVVGTLTQSIKLFACEGIPWTQAWGYMFLLSFVVLEILLLLNWTVDDEELRNSLLDQGAKTPAYPESLSRAIIILAILLHITLMAWILVFSLPPDINDDFAALQWWQTSLLQIFALVFYYVMVVIGLSIAIFGFLPLLLLGFQNWAQRYCDWTMMAFLHLCPTAYRVLILLLMVLATGLVSAIVVHFRLEGRGRRALGFMSSYVCTARLRVSLWDTHESPFGAGQHEPAWIRPLIPWIHTTFCVLTPVVYLVWYATKYDPSGTFKPGWAEKLG